MDRKVNSTATTSFHFTSTTTKKNSEAIQYISSTAFFPINITITCNALPHDVVNSSQ